MFLQTIVWIATNLASHKDISDRQAGTYNSLGKPVQSISATHCMAKLVPATAITMFWDLASQTTQLAHTLLCIKLQCAGWSRVIYAVA